MSEAAPMKNVIAVASGKGGVGKTWFSVTLAHALSRQGHKVLLFDGDLGLANVDIQLGLMPKRDLGAALMGKHSLKQCVQNLPEAGFDILAGRSGTGNLASLPLPRVQRIVTDLAKLATEYDRVIIDLGAGVDKTVQFLAAQAGLCLLVVNDEPTSLTDGYAFIKLGFGHHPDMDIRVVVNVAEDENKGRKTYDTLANACRNFLKKEPPLMGIIQRDTRVREAIRAQVPLITRSPNSQAAADVENIARKI